MNIAQVLKIFHISCTVSIQKVEDGHDTYFDPTQFAVYNGVSHVYKNSAIMEY